MKLNSSSSQEKLQMNRFEDLKKKKKEEANL